MKKLLLIFTFFTFVLGSCTKEEESFPENSLEKELVNDQISSEEDFSLVNRDPLPKCVLTSNDWNNTIIGIGQTKTFGIKYVAGAIYKWTVQGQIKIVGSSSKNSVTIQGTGSGNGYLSVTMDVPDQATKACGNTGRIVVKGGSGPQRPIFHVMDPNWNQNGETCSNCLLELGVISPEGPGFIKYEWKIHGATVQYTTPDTKYIFVRTGAPNTSLYFAVRGIYNSGPTAWYSLRGRTTSIDGGGPF